MADVETNKQGGQTLNHPSIKGQASINRVQAHLLNQLHDGLTRSAIIATDEYVAVDAVLKRAEFVRRDVLECRHDFHTVPQDLLGLLCSRTSGGHEHLAGVLRI